MPRRVWRCRTGHRSNAGTSEATITGLRPDPAACGGRSACEEQIVPGQDICVHLCSSVFPLLCRNRHLPSVIGNVGNADEHRCTQIEFPIICFLGKSSGARLWFPMRLVLAFSKGL